ncbi:nuclear transport factor 2 family protein [Roseovarius sp. SCSIO 43702]|uniref:nuclear transport factor 2 family protein n=1 Tax=Roseovarius sp. SCSIO 43702 TaxID=2823043 RepID=UPI001C730224|nr:nuclear transport factor 2 family protein [Roseovarius sp. SCSIO 43702]QYX55795.1 nuclear transport factor 2 family protein [Roseovarius sp. SCSIO 43702]
MTGDEPVWEIEEGFWCKGLDFYEAHLAPDAVMAFPLPVGILEGDAILDAVDGSTRWEGVLMADRVLRKSGDTCVLIYRATGTREGTDAYTATCTSTYVREDDGWRLLVHHQTPVG